MVHRRHRTDPPARTGHVRRQGDRGGRGRDEVPQLDGGRPRLDPTRRTRTRHARRSRTDAHLVLLQRLVHAVRPVVGRRRRGRCLRRAEPIAHLLPDPDAGPIGCRAVVRRPIAIGIRDRGAPLPARLAIREPVDIARTQSESRTDTHPDAGTTRRRRRPRNPRRPRRPNRPRRRPRNRHHRSRVAVAVRVPDPRRSVPARRGDRSRSGAPLAPRKTTLRSAAARRTP